MTETAVTIYDIARDEMRPITQADVERLQAIERAYGSMRYILRKLLPNPQAQYEGFEWDKEALFLRLAAQKLDDVSIRVKQ